MDQVLSEVSSDTPSTSSPPSTESEISASIQGEYTLPSKGMLYGDAIPEGKVTVTAMNVLDEKRLGGSPKTFEATVSNIISMNVHPMLEDTDDLLAGDKFFLLLCLRAVSYGPTYNFSITCGNCTSRIHHQVDLPYDLGLEFIDPEFEEPFYVTLPHLRKKVGLRLLRVRDTDSVRKLVNRGRRGSNGLAQVGDESYVHRLARSIVSVDGEEKSTMDAVHFVETLYGPDSLAIRNRIEEVDVGVSALQEIECDNCGHLNETFLPITHEFFRPRS